MLNQAGVHLNDNSKEVLNDMCNASEYLVETSKAEGIEIGEERGIVKGQVKAYRKMVADGWLPLEVALDDIHMKEEDFKSYLIA